MHMDHQVLGVNNGCLHISIMRMLILNIWIHQRSLYSRQSCYFLHFSKFLPSSSLSRLHPLLPSSCIYLTHLLLPLLSHSLNHRIMPLYNLSGKISSISLLLSQRSALDKNRKNYPSCVFNLSFKSSLTSF